MVGGRAWGARGGKCLASPVLRRLPVFLAAPFFHFRTPRFSPFHEPSISQKTVLGGRGRGFHEGVQARSGVCPWVSDGIRVCHGRPGGCTWHIPSGALPPVEYARAVSSIACRRGCQPSPFMCRCGRTVKGKPSPFSFLSLLFFLRKKETEAPSF